MTDPRPLYIYDAVNDVDIPVGGSGAMVPHATTHNINGTDPLMSLVVVGSASANVPLIARSAPYGTANLQEWQDGAGTISAAVRNDGSFISGALQNLLATGPYFTLSSTTLTALNRTTASNVPLTVKGMPAQTGDLQQWQNSAATILARVTSDGGVVVNNAASVSGDFRAAGFGESNLLLVDADALTDGAVYIGGTTNGIRISKGGKLSLLGSATVWNDILIEPNVRTTGTSTPTYERYLRDVGGTSNGLYAYSFDNALVSAQKEVFFTLQMPHGKLPNSNLKVHLHWVPKTAGTAGHAVRWGLEYSWANPGTVFPVTTTVYSNTVVSGDISVALSHCITAFPDLTPPENEAPSSILWARLFRDSAHTDDTATITAGLLSIDAHYEMWQLGSNDEYVV